MIELVWILWKFTIILMLLLSFSETVVAAVVVVVVVAALLLIIYLSICCSFDRNQFFLFEVEWFVKRTDERRQSKVCWLIIISSDCFQKYSMGQIWPSSTQHSTHTYVCLCMLVIWFVTVSTFSVQQSNLYFGLLFSFAPKMCLRLSFSAVSFINPFPPNWIYHGFSGLYRTTNSERHKEIETDNRKFIICWYGGSCVLAC